MAQRISRPPSRGREPQGIIARLIWRRVPHWLGAYLAGGFGLVELVGMLEDRGFVGRGAFLVSLATYLLGAPVIFILAWYHGRAGPQQVERLEFGLLLAVAAIWLAVLALYLFL